MYPLTMGGSTQVSVTADPNVSFKERETTLNFSAGGGLTKSVRAVQEPILFIPQVFGGYIAVNETRKVTETVAGIPDMWVGVDAGATYDDQLFFLGLIISRDINWSDFVIFTLRGAPVQTAGYATSSTNL